MESVKVKQTNIIKNTKQYLQYCSLFKLKPSSSFIDIEMYTIKFVNEVKKAKRKNKQKNK